MTTITSLPWDDEGAKGWSGYQGLQLTTIMEDEVL